VKIEINLNVNELNSNRILLDEIDVTNSVCGVELLAHAGELPLVSLTMRPDVLNLNALGIGLSVKSEVEEEVRVAENENDNSD